ADLAGADETGGAEPAVTQADPLSRRRRLGCGSEGGADGAEPLVGVAVAGAPLMGLSSSRACGGRVGAIDVYRKRRVGHVGRARRRRPAPDRTPDEIAPRFRLPCGGRRRLVPFPGDGELGPAGDLPAAVVAALGAGEVIVDVTERLEVAGAAVG